ncbi:hypothetical protein SAMN05443634_10840 [Chishuiella changwenlii]|uniref:Uncharacterized protein n=1 Tax=Chishuiella changwenlii TaxID=1434701 RepID=A0A1M6ZT13_9FLAO|nr:hypothetical protein [Chishuiella changwenlii]GGE92649.1 hypothetical protein GCM10010984_07860 [Chishuiella changwenlii]SHL33485.1 hypothetical protein SAMN05443634_10840 [Chishuiella changwenlii]
MSDISIRVALDFSECTTAQKEVFFEHLNSLNWESINPNKLWITNLIECDNHQQLVDEIEKELIVAKEISNLYELHYAIITNNEIYFNHLN